MIAGRYIYFQIMSLLTEALERILNWLQVNCPSIALFPYPGLAHEQIEQLTKNLPFQLPSEICELYNWRNGTLHGHGFFPFSVFYSLEEAILYNKQEVKYWQEGDDPIALCRLIIFSHNGSFFFVVCEKEEKQSVPIWVEHTGQQPVICYANLTSLILMIAECYETGAYYVDSTKTFLKEDTTKSDKIFRKYNPNIQNRPDIGLY